jgi:Fe-S-cluster containining protein
MSDTKLRTNHGAPIPPATRNLPRLSDLFGAFANTPLDFGSGWDVDQPPAADPCADCGLCCKSLIIEIDHVDVVREPRLLPVVKLLDGHGAVTYESHWEKQYGLAYGRKHPCKLLSDDNRCTIYATRPTCCVAFEVGGEHCNELREENDLPPITAAVGESNPCGS